MLILIVIDRIFGFISARLFGRQFIFYGFYIIPIIRLKLSFMCSLLCLFKVSFLRCPVHIKLISWIDSKFLGVLVLCLTSLKNEKLRELAAFVYSPFVYSCSVAAFTFCESNEETPEVPEPVDTGCPEFIIKQTLPEFVEWLSAATHTMDPSAALIFLEVVRVWVKLSNDPNSPNYVPGKLEAVDQLWLRLLDVRWPNQSSSDNNPMESEPPEIYGDSVSGLLEEIIESIQGWGKLKETYERSLEVSY